MVRSSFARKSILVAIILIVLISILTKEKSASVPNAKQKISDRRQREKILQTVHKGADSTSVPQASNIYPRSFRNFRQQVARSQKESIECLQQIDRLIEQIDHSTSREIAPLVARLSQIPPFPDSGIQAMRMASGRESNLWPDTTFIDDYYHIQNCRPWKWTQLVRNIIERANRIPDEDERANIVASLVDLIRTGERYPVNLMIVLTDATLLSQIARLGLLEDAEDIERETQAIQDAYRLDFADELSDLIDSASPQQITAEKEFSDRLQGHLWEILDRVHVR